MSLSSCQPPVGGWCWCWSWWRACLMEQEIGNVSPPAPMRSGWQSGLLQPKPPQSHARSPATCPREAPRWRGARWWLWGTEPGSRTGAPDHFSNSRFRFSFESGCVRVRPIFIPSSDSEPGFRFLLSHCTEGEGLYSPLGLRCLLPHHQITSPPCHFMLPFLQEGWAQPLVSPPCPSGITTCTSEHLCGNPGHPGAATHISTLKQEVFDQDWLPQWCARSLSAVRERPGCQSRVTSFPAWLPAARGCAVSSPSRGCT